MTNFKKKAIALAAVACVAVTSAASCSKKEPNNGNGSNNNNNTSSQSSDTNSGNSGNSGSEGSTDESGNSVSSGNSGNSGSSTSNSNDPQQIENANGVAIATPFQTGSPDAIGMVDNNRDNVNLDADDPVAGSGEYKSNTASRYCFWVDISEDKNYVFNDDFIEVVFKLKEGIPEKDYAVNFNPDLSTVAGKSVTPDKVIQGKIRVGSDIEAQNVSSESGFVAYGDNVSAKAGDEVVYHINFKNNPGLAGMLVWVYYDSNAMTVEDILPSGQFAVIASKTASTGSR